MSTSEKFFKTAEIRHDLAVIFDCSDPTWSKMRAVLGISGHSCSYAQMVGLWAYAAIRRDDPTGQITRDRICQFIDEQGEDPMAWMPGYVPTSGLLIPAFIPGSCVEVFLWNALRWKVSQSSIDRYSKAVTGLSFNYSRVYTAEQVQAMIRYRCEILAKRSARQIETGKRLAQVKRSAIAA